MNLIRQEEPVSICVLKFDCDSRKWNDRNDDDDDDDDSFTTCLLHYVSVILLQPTGK